MRDAKLVEQVEELAKKHGYNCVGHAKAADLKPTELVRDMCAANTCHTYDKTWSCPPACGSVADFTKKIHSYEDVVVFETVGELEDEFDIDTMIGTSEDHKDRMPAFADEVRKLTNDCLVLAAGPCTLCDECTYPSAPCRFPDRQFVAMEAAGLVVSDTCVAANIPYNHGSDHIAYVSCVVF